MDCQSFSRAWLMSCPAIVRRPPVIARPYRPRVPVKLRHSIVLPEPDSPTMPSDAPGWSANVAESTIRSSPVSRGIPILRWSTSRYGARGSTTISSPSSDAFSSAATTVASRSDILLALERLADERDAECRDRQDDAGSDQEPWRRLEVDATVGHHRPPFRGRRADACAQERERRDGQDDEREIADGVGGGLGEAVWQDVADDDPRPAVAKQLECTHEVEVSQHGGAGSRQLGVARPARQRDRQDQAHRSGAEDRDESQGEDQERERVDAVDEQTDATADGAHVRRGGECTDDRADEQRDQDADDRDEHVKVGRRKASSEDVPAEIVDPERMGQCRSGVRGPDAREGTVWAQLWDDEAGEQDRHDDDHPRLAGPGQRSVEPGRAPDCPHRPTRGSILTVTMSAIVPTITTKMPENRTMPWTSG